MDNQNSASTPNPSLAIATIPPQSWEEPYAAGKALTQGTIFPCLDLPFYINGGGESNEKQMPLSCISKNMKNVYSC